MIVTESEFRKMVRETYQLDKNKRVILYLGDEQQVKELAEAAVGFYEVRKVPVIKGDKIAVELTKLEASGAW